MNILVIGNGFDIAHGLPTGYKDFLKFISIFQRLSANSGFSPSCESEKRMLAFLNKIKEQSFAQEQRALDIWTEIGELVDNNAWLSYFQEIEVSGRWIDFEKEISRVIQALDSARKLIGEKVRHGDKRPSMEAWQYNALRPIFGYEAENHRTTYFELKAFTYRKEQLLKDLNRLTRCLEIYLSEYINNLPIAYALPDIQGLNVDKVLSFNYTDTFRRVYNADGQKKIDYDFIHGRASSKSNLQACNLVIGIDEYLQGQDKDLDNEYIEFKKFYQRIFKGTGNAYTNWLLANATYEAVPFQINKAQYYPQINVYFYGHSLDVTDKDILKQLLTSEWVTATIFYHSKDALGSQIANLVKVIGEEGLIRRTGGSERRIIFKEITPTNIASKADVMLEV